MVSPSQTARNLEVRRASLQGLFRLCLSRLKTGHFVSVSAERETFELSAAQLSPQRASFSHGTCFHDLNRVRPFENFSFFVNEANTGMHESWDTVTHSRIDLNRG